MTYDDIWWHTLQYSISHLCISRTLLHPSIRVIIGRLHQFRNCEGKISAFDVWRTLQWSWWHPNAQELRCERTVTPTVDFQPSRIATLESSENHTAKHGDVRSTNVALEFLPWLLCTRRTIQRPSCRCKSVEMMAAKSQCLVVYFEFDKKTWSWMYLPQKWWYSGI